MGRTTMTTDTSELHRPRNVRRKGFCECGPGLCRWKQCPLDFCSVRILPVVPSKLWKRTDSASQNSVGCMTSIPSLYRLCCGMLLSTRESCGTFDPLTSRTIERILRNGRARHKSLMRDIRITRRWRTPGTDGRSTMITRILTSRSTMMKNSSAIVAVSPKDCISKSLW